jgi:hypothetical protein
MRLLMAAPTFGSVFLLGWLACGVVAAGGTAHLQDGVDLAWAVFLLPTLTLSTTAGELAALRLLSKRAEVYGRAHLLGRIALGAILTLLLCPMVAFGALQVTSALEVDRPELLGSGVLAAAGLVTGAVGLTLGLMLPLGMRPR